MSYIFQHETGYSLVFDGKKPLGFDVAAAADGTGPGTVGERVDELQAAISTLINSSDPDDIDIVDSIEGAYAYDDTPDDNDSLPDRTDRPQGVLGWLATADQTELIAFAHENVERNNEAQFQLEGLRPHLVDATYDAFNKLVEMDLAPGNRHIFRALRRTIGRVGELAVFDRFDAAGCGANGLFWHETKKVAIDRDLLVDGFANPELINTGVHEYFHAVGSIERAGLLQNQAGDQNSTTIALEESVVTHMTNVALDEHDDPDTFIPQFPNAEVYGRIREFTGLTAQYGEVHIPTRDFSMAYFSEERFKGVHATLLKQVDANLRLLLPRYKKGGLDEFASQYMKQTRVGMAGWLQKHIEYMYERTIPTFYNDEEMKTLLEDPVVSLKPTIK